jgi:hypothetical protein
VSEEPAASVFRIEIYLRCCALWESNISKEIVTSYILRKDKAKLCQCLTEEALCHEDVWGVEV